jgi:tetratricopeptide (TPR) repeat protein
MTRWTLPLLCLLAAPLWAQDATCPAVPNRDADTADIYRDLRISRDETDARILTDQLWRIWLEAPDERAQDLLDEALRLQRAANFDGSIAILSDLIGYCPDYAEGYNQRAFGHFLKGDYASALLDLEEALLRDPRHLGALTGKALTQIGLDLNDEAQYTLRLALRINPWLAERRLLTGPPEQAL